MIPDERPLSEYSVAVLIPVHNGERFIRQALETAHNQTHKKLRVIAIDDASTDATPRILEEYKDRITILRSSAKNQAAALNIGLRCVNEDFVALLDVDDLWTQDKISNQIEAWSKYPCNLIVTDFAIGDSPLGDWKSAWVAGGYQQVTTGWAFVGLLKENFVLRSSVLAPTKVLRDLNGFDESISGTDDIDMWLRIAETSQVLAIKKVCCFKRAHKDAMSQSFKSNLSRVNMWKKWVKYLGHSDPQHISIAKKQLCEFMFNYAYINYTAKEGNRVVAAKYFLKSFLGGRNKSEALLLATFCILLSFKERLLSQRLLGVSSLPTKPK